MKNYCLVFLIFSTNAFAFDFKGIELGEISSYEKISNTLSIQCHDETSGKVWCSGETTIVGRPAKAYLSLNNEKILEIVSIKFSPHSFENIAESLTKKFGKAKVKKTVISNSTGASFNQVIMDWENKTSIMRLEKYANKITEGSLLMITNQRADEVAIEIEKKKSDI